MKLNCDPVPRQVTGIAQTISELRSFLPDPPEERASFVDEAIADYDPRCRIFARTVNLRFLFTISILMNLIPQNRSEKSCGGGGLKQTLHHENPAFKTPPIN
jgi:hypothetical protein